MASVISLCYMEPFHLVWHWEKVSETVFCFGWHIHLTFHSSFRALWDWFKWSSMHCNLNAEIIYCTALSGKLGENTGLQLKTQWSIFTYFIWPWTKSREIQLNFSSLCEKIKEQAVMKSVKVTTVGRNLITEVMCACSSWDWYGTCWQVLQPKGVQIWQGENWSFEADARQSDWN